MIMSEQLTPPPRVNLHPLYCRANISRSNLERCNRYNVPGTKACADHADGRTHYRLGAFRLPGWMRPS